MRPERFRELWDTLLPIGRAPSGEGWLRYGWSAADLACRDWFAEQANDRGLAVHGDGNGNLFGWLGDPKAGDAVVTGSHFDSVPGDARAPDEPALTALVEAVRVRATDRAGRDGTSAAVTPESVSPAVSFDPALRERLVAILGGVPVLPTGAGHDAGALADVLDALACR